MQGPYVISPYLWPIIAAASLLLALTVAGLRRRAKAGAVPYAMAAFFSAMLMIGAAFELSAVAVADKFFWVTFQTLWMLPAITAILLFALEFADPGRRLPAWLGGALSIPPILMAAIILTNDQHNLFWEKVVFDLNVHTTHTFIGWLFIVYAYLLTIWTLFVLIRVFIQSPVRRRPVALIIGGVVINRIAFILDVAELNWIAPLDFILPSIVLSAVIYGIALFRYDIFDPIPMARDRVVAQMREGMLVLDTRGRIIESNPEAETVLGRSAAELKGKPLTTLLPLSAELSHLFLSSDPQQSEITLGNGPSASIYSVMLSPISESRGQILGHLLLFHDVTEQKRAQAQLVEQQRVVATLQERERLARELHDSAGQVLGYVSMQAQAIRKHVRDGNLDKAEVQLGRLEEEALAAHIDIRESILSLKAGGSSLPFLEALKQYTDTYGQHYGVRAELAVAGDMPGSIVSPDMSVQLMRVIGEALSNARKHSRADHVRIALDRDDGLVRIAITDDGQGFDPSQVADGGTHFGLLFMRERMAQIGGGLEIDSCPGKGTRVSLWVPARDYQGVER